MFVGRATLKRLAERLATHGIETWTVDFRGHGDSGPTARAADWTYSDIVVQDIPAAARWVAERAGRRPVWIGHSLGAHGGLAAWALFPELPLAGLVSLGGNVWMSRFVPDRLAWLHRQATLAAWTQLTRALGYFPVRRLRLGSDDEARSYVKELAEIFTNDRYIVAGREVLPGLSAITAPVLSVTSVGDAWMCPPAAARALLGHVSRAPVVHRVVGELADDPRTVDHMGLVLDKRMMAIVDETVAPFVLACG